MNVDEIQTPVVAGPALPLADHAAILPELAEWARGQMADGSLDEDQLAAIFAHSQHLRSLAWAHPDLIAAVPQGRGSAEVTVTYGSLSATVPLEVWYPSGLSLVADDATLNLLASCGSASKYQRTRLRLFSGGLELTPLLREGHVSCTAGLLTLEYVDKEEEGV